MTGSGRDWDRGGSGSESGRDLDPNFPQEIRTKFACNLLTSKRRRGSLLKISPCRKFVASSEVEIDFPHK